jgi:hypothetical protein
MMKTIRERISGKTRRPLLALVFMMTTLLSYAGGLFPVPTAVMITKNLNNRKHKVKLFTASDYKTLLFTVDGVQGQRYTLFVFDLEGKLITQTVIQNRETGILPEIGAGAYLYEVLADDKKVETGQLKVK